MWHATSGQGSTGPAGDTSGVAQLWLGSLGSPAVLGLTSPGCRVHSSGRWAGGRVGYVCWSQASVVSLGWKCGVLSGGYRNQRWKTPGAHPLPIPLQPLGLSPRGASLYPGTPVRGLFLSPPFPDPSPRAQFSPSCQKSPRRNQGRASGRERQSLSLRWNQGLVLGRAPNPIPRVPIPHPPAIPKL